MSVALSYAEQLCFCTVRLECELSSGGTSVGTSFFLGFPSEEKGKTIPLLVTNRHVIKDARRGTFRLTSASEDGTPLIGQSVPAALDNFEDRWIAHPDDNVDLCFMFAGTLFAEAESKGLQVFHRQFSPDIVATAEFLASIPVLQEVIMIGYPAGWWDEVNNMPILRRGILAKSPHLEWA